MTHKTSDDTHCRLYLNHCNLQFGKHTRMNCKRNQESYSRESDSTKISARIKISKQSEGGSSRNVESRGKPVHSCPQPQPAAEQTPLSLDKCQIQQLDLATQVKESHISCWSKCLSWVPAHTRSLCADPTDYRSQVGASLARSDKKDVVREFFLV